MSKSKKMSAPPFGEILLTTTIIRVEEAFMKGARHDKEWDDTNDT